ncbi:hypothetical protein NDU88_003270 [Pleurodeles waltl]|uniref:Uncharacterized protein n=1 Tax=Pleurodeles waltl TaxID=8319 RepID=A0AAV7WNL9_PLEWA|nr:hypothetical protein NDU88_003270 [Pleurodeles waltl]
MTTLRSKDRGGHSVFPAGLAGDRQKAAGQPSGKPLPTRTPAPNGAGVVGRVRRVQLHTSRISVSAMQTLKFYVGPAYGGPTTPLTAILFLAVGTARNRMAVRGTAGFPDLTAAKPPQSECPAGHRQPVGGAPPGSE